jgi:hypothetical protein
MKNSGFRIFHPPVYVDDWRAAYGLECIRIWKEAVAHLENTGEELDVYYPTEKEFREMRKELVRKRIYDGDGG